LIALLVTFVNCDCGNINGFNNTNLDFLNFDKFLRNFLYYDVAVVNNSHFIDFGCQLKLSNLSGFDIDQWYAFWINTYNYMAIFAVVSNPCKKDLFSECGQISSIIEVGMQQPALPLFTPGVWSMKLIEVAGSKVSFRDVINNLRKPGFAGVMNPSFWFTLSPTSVSGPMLLPLSYQSNTINEQMKSSTRDYLAIEHRGIYFEQGSLYLSAIFAWNWKDFDNETLFKEEGIQSTSTSVQQFLVENVPENIKDKIASLPPIRTSNDFNIIRYSWKLNRNMTSASCHQRTCFPLWSLVTSVMILVTTVLFVAICVIGCCTRTTYE